MLLNFGRDINQSNISAIFYEKTIFCDRLYREIHHSGYTPAINNLFLTTTLVLRTLIKWKKTSIKNIIKKKIT